MDDIEEDLEDFGEYIRAAIEGKPLPEASSSYVRDEFTDGASGHQYAGVTTPTGVPVSSEEAATGDGDGEEYEEHVTPPTQIAVGKAASPSPSPGEGGKLHKGRFHPPGYRTNPKT